MQINAMYLVQIQSAEHLFSYPFTPPFHEIWARKNPQQTTLLRVFKFWW